MSELIEDIKALDRFYTEPLPELVDRVRDNPNGISDIAMNNLLRVLQIPASYYNKASESLQRSMIIEGISDKKKEIVRVAVEDESSIIIGIGPDLPSDLTMKSAFKTFPGKTTLVTGSLRQSGMSYIFKKLDSFTVNDQEIMSGYNVQLSSMLCRGVSFRPQLCVVLCSNGLVEPKQIGKEFKITLQNISFDYINVAADSIASVCEGMASKYKDSIAVAMEEIVEPGPIIEDLLESRSISKGLHQKSLKILEHIIEGTKEEDPAFPTSASTKWDIIQILSYVARSTPSASGRLSAEMQTMRFLLSK